MKTKKSRTASFKDGAFVVSLVGGGILLAILAWWSGFAPADSDPALRGGSSESTAQMPDVRPGASNAMAAPASKAAATRAIASTPTAASQQTVVFGTLMSGNEPVSEASIQFFLHYGIQGNALSVTNLVVQSGSAGEFEFVLPRLRFVGGQARHAERGGVFHLQKEEPAARIGPITIALLAPATVRGTVRSASSKEPLAGIEVKTSASDFVTNSPPAFTGKDGRYELFIAPPGTVSVYALKSDSEGRPEVGSAATVLHLAEGQVREGVDFELGAPPTLRGQVLAPDGTTPVEGASVALESLFQNPKPELLTRLTDKDGRFEVRIPPRNSVLKAHVSKAGLMTKRTQVEVAAFGVTEIQIVMGEPAGRVFGRVVDERGAPLDEALLVLNQVQGDRANNRWGALAPGFGKTNEFLYGQSHSVAETRSGADGSFAFEECPAGSFWLWAMHADRTPVSVGPLALAAKTETGPLNVVMTGHPADHLLCRVLWEGGRPAREVYDWQSEVRLKVRRLDGKSLRSDASWGVSVNPDVEGRFFAPLGVSANETARTPVPLELTVSSSGYLAATQTVHLASTPWPEVVFHLKTTPESEVPGRIRGVVVLPDGSRSTVPCHLQLLSDRAHDSTWEGFEPGNPFGFVDTDRSIPFLQAGAFEIEKVPLGRFVVRADVAQGFEFESALFLGGMSAPVELTAAAPVAETQIPLKPTEAWLELTLLDAETGELVEDAGVYAHGTVDGRFTSFPSKKLSSGKYRIGGLAGECRLTAHSQNHNPQDTSFMLVAGQTGSLTLELLRSGEGTIAGRVLLPGGGPAVGARVTSDSGKVAVTGSDGRFRFNDVPAQPENLDARLEARLDGFGAARTPEIEVRPGKVSEITIQLTQGATIQGQVTRHGTPVAGISVASVIAWKLHAFGLGLEPDYLKTRLGATMSVSGQDGVFRLNAVEPYRIKLLAFQDGKVLSYSEEFDAQDGQVHRVDLRLPGEPCSLSGTVKGPTGQPIPQMNVFLVATPDTLRTQTDARGFYQFTDVRDGPATVSYVGVDGTARTVVRDISFDSGPRQTLDITLPAGGHRLEIVVLDAETRKPLEASVSNYGWWRRCNREGLAVVEDAEPGEHRFNAGFQGYTGGDNIQATVLPGQTVTRVEVGLRRAQ